MKNEIILYRPDELAEHIEVRLEDETVWLSQQQMASLFNQTKQNISLHINNCFKEKELEPNSVVRESLTTDKDGRKYNTKFYNLDAIISVGYRVKSKQATQKVWFYSLNLDRNLSKTNPLNENDLAEFLALQKIFADSENSWTVNIKDIDQSAFDLSLKNPNKKEETSLRKPQDILEEMKALDEESAEILQAIKQQL